MKRTGIDHPKTRRLAKLLGVPMFSAVGVLECVWHFTARHAIRGDIGRWNDHEIADAIGWPAEDAERLIPALVDAGWLDRCQSHRLVVHDWQDHCDEAVKKTVQRKGWEFAQPIPIVSVNEACRDLSRNVATSSAVVATCLDSQSLSQSQSRSQSQSLLSSPDGDGSKGAQGSPTSGQSKAAPKFTDDDLKLAQEMFDGIRAIHPDARPPNFDRWANSLRLLRNDGRDRTPEQIRATLAWIRADSFWKTNVLSPDKLREKWDTLQVKLREAQNAQRTNVRTTTSNANGTYRPVSNRRATF